MLFSGLIHSKQAMCYSSQEKGHEDRKLFFLPKYEKYILQSRANQLMTSRVLAGPTAALPGAAILTQHSPRPHCCLPSLPERGWQRTACPVPFSLAQLMDATVGFPNSTGGSPKALQLTASLASFSELLSTCHSVSHPWNDWPAPVMYQAFLCRLQMCLRGKQTRLSALFNLLSSRQRQKE